MRKTLHQAWLIVTNRHPAYSAIPVEDDDTVKFTPEEVDLIRSMMRIVERDHGTDEIWFIDEVDAWANLKRKLF